MKFNILKAALVAVFAVVAGPYSSSIAFAGQAIEGRGVVEPARLFAYRLKPGDIALELYVTEGSRVRKGDRLLRLANVDLVSKVVGLRQSKIWYLREMENLAALDQELAEEERNMARIMEQLGKPELQDGPTATRLKEEKRKVSERLRTLKARKENSGAEKGALREAMKLIDESLGLLNKQLGALDVVAPFDGVARSVTKDAESLTSPMMALEVRDETTLAVRVDLWQHQIPYVKVGQKARIYPDFYGETNLEGVVTGIEPPMASPGLRDFPKFPVTVRIVSPDSGLLVGMVVSVKLAAEEGRDESR
ncbi:MAG: efflux RND transporter periplasmic adaptor subunit [Nitrospinota bacterium]|nr:efflux RND transporter periplasmic adaptor subunit [Nitrospinota bacterium]